MNDIDVFSPAFTPSPNIEETTRVMVECGIPPADALALATARDLVKIKTRMCLVMKLTGISTRDAKRMYKAVGRSSPAGLGPSGREWFLQPVARVLSANFLASWEAAEGSEATKLYTAFTANPSFERGWTPERAYDLVKRVERNDFGYGPCIRCGEATIAATNHLVCPYCDDSQPLQASARLRDAFTSRSIRRDFRQFL